MNGKKIVFSHESDIDGLGCVILGKLAFGEFDYVLMPNIEKLERCFEDYIRTGGLDKYSEIYVTDLALYDPALTMVAASNLRNKVHVFDHHKRTIDDNMDRYDFTKIVIADENEKKCGTSLFYEYLTRNNLVKTSKAIDEFVELTRLEDTWEWKKMGKFGEKAHDLAILFNGLGIDDYISRITSKLLNNWVSFEFDEKEISLIQGKKDEYERVLKVMMDTVEYFWDDNMDRFGIVYANYEYRNEIAEYIRKNGNPYNIKYLIVVAMDKGEFGQKSYRAIVSEFDVNEVASKHGGGGHVGAAAVNITEEQKSKVLSLTKREGLKYLADSSYL